MMPGTGSCPRSASWTSSRRYLDRTLVLETTFSTAAGTLVLTDAMALGPDNGGHRIGTDVPHLLVRKLACTDGEVEVEVDYQPRPEYGLIVPLLHHVEGGITARGGAEWLVLTADGLSIDGAARPRAAHVARRRGGLPRPAPFDAGADAGPRVVAGGAGRRS